ncbi:MAG: NYN domain-containing protein [Candidatus Jacksonbacteria bacterium]
MDLQEFKSYNIKQKLKIDDGKFGEIFIFIDFANVNNWFAEDVRDWNNNILDSDKKLSIDLEKMFDFTKCFSSHVRFYYGYDPKNESSMKFLGKTKYVFGENLVFTKPIQQIKHYLKEKEKIINTRQIQRDNEGIFVYLPKCNFDVEICVDAIRLMGKYNTFCLFSSDADFVSLIKFLKNNRKKVILIKGGHVQYSLKANSDLIINAQDIKSNIACIKQKSSQ